MSTAVVDMIVLRLNVFQKEYNARTVYSLAPMAICVCVLFFFLLYVGEQNCVCVFIFIFTRQIRAFIFL